VSGVAAGPAYVLFPSYVIRQSGRYFSIVFVVRVLDQNSLLMTSALYWPVVVLHAISISPGVALISGYIITRSILFSLRLYRVQRRRFP